MRFKTPHRKYLGYQVSPWIIIGTALILLVMLIVLTYRNVNRGKQQMSLILAEKGAALIRAVEAGARTGMMGMMWGGDQVQRLLEETARQSHVLYIGVVDGNGKILAHSDPQKINTTLLNQFPFSKTDDPEKEKWRLREIEKKRAFEVYRYFRPLGKTAMDKIHDLLMERMGMMMGRGRGNGMGKGMGRGPGRGLGRDWCFPENPGACCQIIFVGLDVTPYEQARLQDIRTTAIFSGVLILIGFGGFLTLFLTQSYQSMSRMLQDARIFAEEVVLNLPVGLIATGKKGEITYINPAAEKITGIMEKNVRDKKMNEILPDGLMELQSSLERGITILEKDMDCTFGRENPVPVSISASRIFNPDGGVVGDILILRDLAEVRKLQKEIRRREKLAALGGLAAGVAHEIRNPLSSIKGLASFFGTKFEEGSEEREAANVMVNEVERLNRAISELLDFARPSELRLRPADINDVLSHTVRLAKRDAEMKKIHIDFQPEKGLPEIDIDQDRLAQCLLNLYLNAIQAMDMNGTLFVKTLPSKNGGVRIQIQDTGKGIDPENLSRIFDPYYTTKPKGTGLGLAIVHKIIEAHQGRIDVESEPGRGTIFSIELPSRTKQQ